MQHVAVQIETDDGKVEATFAESGLDLRIVSRAPSDGTILRFIDPYGDLVVNRLQLPELVSELHQVHADAVEDDLRRHIEELLSFIDGAMGVHSYVRFVGD